MGQPNSTGKNKTKETIKVTKKEENSKITSNNDFSNV
jgi:hypothetical protein